MSLTRNRTAASAGDVDAAVDEVRAGARPLTESGDLDRLVAAVGDASYVLLGEATHGTSEFYRWRAALTARLIRERDFSFVAVEGDWTDCDDANRYVKHESEAGDTAAAVLSEFDRWPTWLWANWEVAAFLDWLRAYNAERPEAESVGFYGLDVYSLFESMAEVIEYLERIDPPAADRARDAYNCFEPYAEDARQYAQSTRLVPEDCEDEVVDLLTEVRTSRPEDGDESPDAFSAEQNALVAKNAEEYYRAMAKGNADSWNVRDRHMVETLERLVDHHGSDGKAVVWAHNTHVGDARATDMQDRGKVNVGQLVRESHAEDDVAIVGFGTHRGTVIAGDEWEAPMERMSVPPGREESYEDVFHRAGEPDGPNGRYLLFDEMNRTDALDVRRGHRAVGVVYDPSRELGNYVPTALPERYDAFVHFDETEALHPLHIEPDGDEEPEAYPWGF